MVAGGFVMSRMGHHDEGMAALSRYSGLRCVEFHVSGAQCERAAGHAEAADQKERLHVGSHRGRVLTWRVTPSGGLVDLP